MPPALEGDCWREHGRGGRPVRMLQSFLTQLCINSCACIIFDSKHWWAEPVSTTLAFSGTFCCFNNVLFFMLTLVFDWCKIIVLLFFLFFFKVDTILAVCLTARGHLWACLCWGLWTNSKNSQTLVQALTLASGTLQKTWKKGRV